jgi:hypothetical protein
VLIQVDFFIIFLIQPNTIVIRRQHMDILVIRDAVVLWLLQQSRLELVNCGDGMSLKVQIEAFCCFAED